MVNINVEIPDEIHKKLKLISVHKEKSLKEIIIKALEESVSEAK